MVWAVNRATNFPIATDIEAEGNSERQRGGIQALFDGEIVSSGSESDKLDAIEDDEGDFELNVCWKDILFKLHIVSV